VLRAELVALETRAAEMAPFRINPVVVFCKNTHRAHVHADTASDATVGVKVDLETNRGRGTDLQKNHVSSTSVCVLLHKVQELFFYIKKISELIRRGKT
jgi:hypothetical protein